MERPIDLESCVEYVLDKLPSHVKRQIKNNFLSEVEVHFGFGMALRNELGLWEKESSLVKWFEKTFNLTHADDISGIIISATWAKIKEIPYDPAPQVKKYLDHWEKMKAISQDPPPFLFELRTKT